MSEKNYLTISRKNWEYLTEYKKTSSRKRYQELLELEELGC